MEIVWKILFFGLVLTVSSATAAVKNCIVCDSSNADCLKNPEKITGTACTTSCFTSIDNNGNLKRGCVDATNNKCDSPKTCKKCETADSCNNETNLFWCKTCDSSTNADCAQNDATIENNFCESGITKCLMQIKPNSKDIERRCANKDESCAADNKKCAICDNETSCNKGVYPTDRHRCYQCENCGSTASQTALPCKLYDENDKCFEYGSEATMTRGCVSDETAYKKCTSETPTEKCKSCTGNDCNSDEFKVESADCIQCTVDDTKCVWGFQSSDAKKCTNKVEYYKTQGCYTNKVANDKVARGCLSDFDCAANSATCTSCSGTACNNANTAAVSKCRVCDSSNADCLKNPEKVPEPECKTACFTSIDNNGNLKRGCVDDNNKCENQKICKKCESEDSCNKETNLFWCKTCDSSASADCAQKDATVENNFCESGITKCLMQIKPNSKDIERRCAAKDDTCAADNKKCAICDKEASCNKGVYPTDRRRCYQCENCGSTTGQTALPCKLYDENDKCFEYGSETAMTRGCVSDETAYKKCTSETPTEKCKSCTGDDCNSDEFKVESADCIQCTVDDAKCVWGFQSSDAKKCTNKVEYYKTQGCYTNKVADDKVARGCLSDFDCAGNAATCTSCNGTACNNGDTVGYQCIKCRSDDNPDCAKKQEADTFKGTCRNPVTQEDQGCYTESWDGIVIRSCLVDCDEKTRKNCKDDKYKKCDVCKEVNCNKGDPPNSAHSLALATGMLTLTLMCLKFF